MQPPHRKGAGRGAEADDRDDLARLGEAFADPSRRDLFRRVTRSPEPLSAGELAAESGLHRTVVRAHMERLVELGLLTVSLRHTGRGGRPARVFSPAERVVSLSLPTRRYEWLARGLLSVLPAVAADGDALRRAVVTAGARAGRQVAPGSPQAAVDWLGRHGYAARLFEADGRPLLEVRACVVAELAPVAPELVCGYDVGFVCGLFGLSPGSIEQVASRATGDDACRLLLPGTLRLS